MASMAVTPRIYPKRKRANISYHESSSEESEVDDEYNTQDEKATATTRKKLKTSHTAVSTEPLPKRKIFPFTSLPAELRNQIYLLALTDPCDIFLISKTKRYRRTVERLAAGWQKLRSSAYPNRDRYYPPVSKPSLVPNLLLLNQAIYAETQPILYAGNTFNVEDTTAMHTFLATIGPKNRATISDLTISGWGYTRAHKALNYPAFTMLAGAVNLTRLHINCNIAELGGPKRQARVLYRDGFGWLEAVARAKGKFDAAVDIINIPARYMNHHSYVGAREGTKEWEKSKEESKKIFNAELRKLLS